MSGDPAPRAAPEVVVRPARPDDDVDPVVRSAFGAEGAEVSALWAEVTAGDLLRGSLVAEVPGAGVVGHVGLSHAWVDARRALVDVWMLSPLSVVPEHQRQGIGSLLLDAAVALALRGGTPMLVLEGSPAYYGRRGFVPAADHGVHPASDRTPPPACQLVLLPAHEAWMTGRVIYPDVWWRHGSAGLRDPVLAEVEQALGTTTYDEERGTR